MIYQALLGRLRTQVEAILHDIIIRIPLTLLFVLVSLLSQCLKLGVILVQIVLLNRILTFGRADLLLLVSRFLLKMLLDQQVNIRLILGTLRRDEVTVLQRTCTLLLHGLDT